MQRHLSLWKIVAAASCASGLFCAAAFADPLHKFAKQDAYWHHGSGFVYPRAVAGLQLDGSPTQIDGNDDVTGDYLGEVNGTRVKAVVDVYLPTSAAAGAKLDTAKDAAATLAGACETKRTEAPFSIEKHPEVAGVKVSFMPAKSAAKQCAPVSLYFFRVAKWVVTVRANGAGGKELDEFVRGLRWETLGTDPFDHDTSP